MKKKRSVVTTILCILIALVVIGWLFGRGNGETPRTDEGSGALLVLTPTPAPENTSQPDTPAENSAAAPAQGTDDPSPEPDDGPQTVLDEESAYNSRDEVALYIHSFGHLPPNYVTKAKARAAGWDGGSLEKYYPGCSIGGDVFGNREGLLPAKNGRTYYECDIDTAGKSSRGAKRIVFSDDGLIYYTDDHYESFTLLYGEDGT